MVVIANSNSHTKGSHWAGINMLVTALACLCMSGCTSTMDLFGGDKVDRTISTGTVPGKARSGETLSDEMTVRNAVTSADLTKVAANPVPWANTSTGSAGVVSTIKEDESQGRLCRAFTTTRHSYEGIAMFSGQACRTEGGDWLLTAFDRR